MYGSLREEKSARKNIEKFHKSCQSIFYLIQKFVFRFYVLLNKNGIFFCTIDLPRNYLHLLRYLEYSESYFSRAITILSPYAEIIFNAGTEIRLCRLVN